MDKIFKNLYSIFTTFFSLKDVEKEISGEVKVALSGDSPRVEELYLLLKGKEASEEAEEPRKETPEELKVVKFPPEEEDMAFMQKCDIAVIILKEAAYNVELIKLINMKINQAGKPQEEQKILWFVDGTLDELKKDEIKDIFEEAAVEDIHWIESEWSSLPKLILVLAREKGLSYAERFGYLRDEMTRKLVARTASENAYISFFSSLPSNIPIIGIIIGLIAVAGETLFITANQLRMCLRIAGMFGYKVDFYERMGELWPVLAGAFGWRTLARSLSGFIPGGGPLVKTSIAYAGTMTIGEAARWYYREGKKLNREEMKDIYLHEKAKVLDNFDGFLKKLKKQEPIDNEDQETAQ